MTSTERSEEPQTLEGKDLSVTALYTAHTWAWAGFEGAELFASDQTRAVFKVTNGALTLMRLFRWGLPRLPEGLAQRHLLIDQLTEEYKADVILELAAGLSSRALRFSKPDSSSLRRYLEVDLPHVIEFKESRYREQELNLPLLTLHPLDLQMLDIMTLRTWLESTSRPLIIAEGIIMYLSASDAQRLLEQIAEVLRPRGGRLIFDWVPTVEQPRPGFIGRCLAALMRLFTGGQDFQRDERTRQSMCDALETLGAYTKVYDTRRVAAARELPHAHLNTQQLIFCADWSMASTDDERDE